MCILQVVGGAAGGGGALAAERHDILHRADGAAREQALHSHLRALVVLFRLLRIPLRGPRYFQCGHLQEGEYIYLSHSFSVHTKAAAGE